MENSKQNNEFIADHKFEKEQLEHDSNTEELKTNTEGDIEEENMEPMANIEDEEEELNIDRHTDDDFQDASWTSSSTSSELDRGYDTDYEFEDDIYNIDGLELDDEDDCNMKTLYLYGGHLNKDEINISAEKHEAKYYILYGSDGKKHGAKFCHADGTPYIFSELSRTPSMLILEDRTTPDVPIKLNMDEKYPLFEDTLDNQYEVEEEEEEAEEEKAEEEEAEEKIMEEKEDLQTT